jgi:hypothetical protein
MSEVTPFPCIKRPVHETITHLYPVSRLRILGYDPSYRVARKEAQEQRCFECNTGSDVRHKLVYTAHNIHVISHCLYINLEFREHTNFSHTGGKNCHDDGLFNAFAYQTGRSVTF